jgi:hypothetical protein
VVLAMSVFFNFAAFGGLYGPADRRFLGATFYGSVLLWAAAFAVMLQQRDVPAFSARWVLWPIVLGTVVYPLILEVTTRLTNTTLRSWFRGAGVVSVGTGVVVLAAQLLRRPRLRAVR